MCDSSGALREGCSSGRPRKSFAFRQLAPVSGAFFFISIRSSDELQLRSTSSANVINKSANGRNMAFIAKHTHLTHRVKTVHRIVSTCENYRLRDKIARNTHILYTIEGSMRVGP